jgi:cell wall-associated NlpC family hydrolase
VSRKLRCPVCHSPIAANAKKCRHCHNYLGFSFMWLWEEGSRVLGLVATAGAALVAWKSLQLTLISQHQKDEAVTQSRISQLEREALKEDLGSETLALEPLKNQLATAADKSLARAADKSNDLRVRKLLLQALKLKQDGVPFRMGGKSPEEGFDSSGFVSYLLAESGALDPMYHRTFSVARLEKTFPKIKPEDAKPGDLVFLGSTFVAVNLDGILAVGIGSSKGIQVFSFLPKAKKSFHRWAYEQDTRLQK